MYSYKIGDYHVQMDFGDIPVRPERHLALFRCDEQDTGQCIQLKFRMEPLSSYLSNPLGKDNGVYVPYQVDGKLFLSYHWGRIFDGFGIWPGSFSCVFDPQMLCQPPLDIDWFFGVSGFHSILLNDGAAILHASYVDAGGKAILFTAPSQTGKSTQANLWKQHAQAEIINGDRVLLRKKDGKWHAWGYPGCGSSNICVNRTLPLGAIVVLSQGPENRVISMRPGNIIRSVATAIECYPWEPHEIDLALDIGSMIAQEIPVVHLACRPDADAVYTLRDYLTKEGIL